MIGISVKLLSTLSRGLRAVEAIAVHQPVGLADLARLLGEDKSAIQRTLATLHAAGWIRTAAESSVRWEVTAKPLAVAGHALTASPLPGRARALLGSLRDATGETAHLALVDGATIVVVDVAEGKQIVRTALYVGQVVPFSTSAAGRAVCAHLDADARAEFSGFPEEFLPESAYVEIRERGWSVSDGDVKPGTTSIAGAVMDSANVPVGAVVVSGPSARLTPEKYPDIGPLIQDVVFELRGLR